MGGNMKHFNFLSQKKFFIQLIFLLVILVVSSCDAVQDNLNSNQDSATENISDINNQDNTQNINSNTKNETPDIGSNSNDFQNDASNVDNNSNIPFTIYDIRGDRLFF